MYSRFLIDMRSFRMKLFVLFSIALFIFYFNYQWYNEQFRLQCRLPYQSCSTVVYTKPVFSMQKSAKESRGAIAILTNGNYTQLALSLSSLDVHLHDHHKNHIIIFHTGYPLANEISLVLRSTKRHVLFHNVDREFISYPTGFNPYSSEPTWSKRGKWNYHNMIRFWFKFLFELPEIQQYDYIMRIDDDSKLLGSWFDVFTMMRRTKAVYFANDQSIDSEDGLPGTMELKEICFAYEKKINIPLDNLRRLNDAFLDNGIKTYYNNFEIMKIEFFHKTHVREWIQMIDATHGIYKYRWGDAILRYLTLALFARSDQILHRENYTLPYCHAC